MSGKDLYRRYKIPEKITVRVDTREKFPILFPECIHISHPEKPFLQIPILVDVETKKLDYGDYALAGYEDVCVFERKASQLEIYKNLSEHRDRIRQAKAFRRLSASCKHPYLLIEASPAELLTGGDRVKQPEIVCHRLSMAIAQYGLGVLFIPWKGRNANTRRKVGTLMLHIMVGYILRETLDAVPANLL